MALKISPRNTLDNILVGTKCSQTLDISKKLKTDTVASCSYKIYDSSDTDVTDTFGGGSSISSGIITFGIKAISAGTYTLQFIITCNEVLPDGITPREFYITMTIQIIATTLVKPEPEENPFVFTVQTTGADETFSLPLEASGTYDFNVDWGDENSDDITTYNQAEVTHTYANAGTYEISITGTIVGWRFNWAGDYAKIYEIKSWGSLRLGNSGGYFYGCLNLTVTATDILDLTGTINLQSLFDGCISLKTVPSMNSWDMSSVESVKYMACDATSFNQDISSCDMSSVIDMGWMLSDAHAFNQDIGLWNVSSVANMEGMLYNAFLFEQDLGSLNITSVTNMGFMLSGVTLSTANYDALLIGWESQAVQDNVSFHGGNSKYSAGAAATARQDLITNSNWTITDGGAA